MAVSMPTMPFAGRRSRTLEGHDPPDERVAVDLGRLHRTAISVHLGQPGAQPFGCLPAHAGVTGSGTGGAAQEDEGPSQNGSISRNDRVTSRSPKRSLAWFPSVAQRQVALVATPSGHLDDRGQSYAAELRPASRQEETLQTVSVSGSQPDRSPASSCGKSTGPGGSRRRLEGRWSERCPSGGRRGRVGPPSSPTSGSVAGRGRRARRSGPAAAPVGQPRAAGGMIPGLRRRSGRP